MARSVKISKNNMLANSPHYGKILAEYNALSINGKVNAKKFFEDIIHPLIPEYGMRQWYRFLEKFQSAAGGLQAAVVEAKPFVPALPQERQLLSNTMATASLVSTLLNVSAQRAKELAENPELLTHKEAIELGLKTMKAQDSRIHAIGKIREDNREQEKFDRAFSGAASSE